MQPADKHPEVVYRKTRDAEATRVRSAWTSLRGYAPTLVPLIVGFLLLLGLISGLGFLTVNRIDTVSFYSRDQAFQRTARLSLFGSAIESHGA